MTALSDSVEPIAGSDHPCVRRWTLPILSKILEHRWVFRRQRRKIIDSLVNPGCQAGGGYVVPQNSTIHDLREKAGLRNQFAHELRDVLLAFGSKGLLIASPSTECDDHDFPLFQRGSGKSAAP